MKYIQPGILTLFWMELDAKDVASFDCSSNPLTAEIDFCRDIAIVLTHKMIDVREIKTLCSVTVKQRGRPGRSRIVSAEVRHLVRPVFRVERHNVSRNQPQSFMQTVFMALVGEKLHTQAYAQ